MICTVCGRRATCRAGSSPFVGLKGLTRIQDLSKHASEATGSARIEPIVKDSERDSKVTRRSRIALLLSEIPYAARRSVNRYMHNALLRGAMDLCLTRRVHGVAFFPSHVRRYAFGQIGWLEPSRVPSARK